MKMSESMAAMLCELMETMRGMRYRGLRAKMPAVIGGRSVAEIRYLVRLLAVNRCVWTA